ncbi:MAG: thioredoxin family protein [Elusimicrobia bacterium]|nr:thioredoxin family protein [Candidatus Obscuribacterium magneticum]
MNLLLSIIVFIALGFSPGCQSRPRDSADSSGPQITAELLSSVSQIKPGDTFLLGVRLTLEKGWHVYWKTPGQAGLPTTVTWTVPPGVRVSGTLYPKPEIFAEPGDITTLGYKDRVTFLHRATVDSRARENRPLLIKAQVDWLACKTACIPGKKALEIALPVGKKSIIDSKNKAFLDRASRLIQSEEEEKAVLGKYASIIREENFLQSLGTGNAAGQLPLILALLFAFIGGLILNVMPCILPVLSIKVMRFLKQSDVSRSHVVKENLFFAGGVWISFLLLATVVALLKRTGQEVGWGFQFQEPRFLVVLAAVVFGFALSLFGLYDFSIALPSGLTQLTREKGWGGPFWEGILATTLATPCSAPLLGPALGFAFSQPTPFIFLFFLIIGTGLAVPYLLLAAAPGWIRILPKPGPWMEILKKILGLPLLGTSLWLISILNRQVGVNAIIGTALLLGSIAAAMLILKKWALPTQPSLLQWAGRILGLGLVLVTYVTLVEPALKSGPSVPIQRQKQQEGLTTAIPWQPFSLETLQQRLQKNKTIFVDFTADWCLTCKVNEKTALSSPRIARLFSELKIDALKADWTNRDPHITKVLKQLGRSGVPVYVVFKKGDAAHPLFLPEILTEGIVERALKTAASSSTP